MDVTLHEFKIQYRVSGMREFQNTRTEGIVDIRRFRRAVGSCRYIHQGRRAVFLPVNLSI